MKKVIASYFVTAWCSIGLLIDLATNPIQTGSRIGHVDCQPSNSLGFVISSITFNIKHGLSSVPVPVRYNQLLRIFMPPQKTRQSLQKNTQQRFV